MGASERVSVRLVLVSRCLSMVVYVCGLVCKNYYVLLAVWCGVCLWRCMCVGWWVVKIIIFCCLFGGECWFVSACMWVCVCMDWRIKIIMYVLQQ